MSNVHAYILAGGSGARFWPLSREMSPKQLLGIFGTESLIAQAVRRVLPLVNDADAVRIVTNERLVDELRNNLCSNPDVRMHGVGFLIEPVGRNTAPAIALAAASLATTEPNGVMIVLPSDHVLEDGGLWLDAMESAVALAGDGYLVTIGLQPTRAETGYGYIETGERLRDYDRGAAQAYAAASFVEKPEAGRAREYVDGGKHLWNGGIFVMRADRLLEELRTAGPEGERIAEVSEWVVTQPADTWTTDAVLNRFGALPALPIDKAVMERSDKVAVIPAALGWSDVGSLLALENVALADEAGNVVVGRGLEVDCNDTIVYARERCVAALGLEGMLVVDTEDATLVAPKDRAQDVRLVVEALKARGDAEVAKPKTALRPWGSWSVLQEGPGFKIKRIEVAPGRRLSLQRHAKRSEHWVVVRGVARVTRDAETLDVGVNESTFIPVGMTHRLENPGAKRLVIIEVQVGEYVGEDDIERLDDDWDR